MKTLKDGRKLFTTHNGFKFFVEDKTKKITGVTEEYYLKALKHSVEEIPFKKRNKKTKNNRFYGIKALN